MFCPVVFKRCDCRFGERNCSRHISFRLRKMRRLLSRSISSQVRHASSFRRIPVSTTILIIVRNSCDSVALRIAEISLSNIRRSRPRGFTSFLTCAVGSPPGSAIPQSIEAVFSTRLRRFSSCITDCGPTLFKRWSRNCAILDEVRLAKR